ncbi:extradiol ring-cleavage dioxygenase [Piscinibacter gummiphilus]|uniref:Extradiol ring-cleavage dioxygenase n=1 Tax=Piscinibacter gummiphilus TaxID=946333 RepID=A0A1W6L5S8_9BURK|nr:extradiol ring-cleavage dioxygenase [Piscinibacter gummiphilus]ARN19623.1 extradiol ring-cleavage dioxygenase [Piscinibacter gummiphilus]ATU64292.1 extradiol ring-cleavage dioxygenase [Piscinibacter gummiphilus]GLS93491.1 hypothetical protein GCM10007918_07820 [Piscinibacter gummiphilus]
MSRNVLEKLMHQLCIDRATKQRFRDEPEKLLQRLALTDEEKAMLLSFDVAGLQRLGVNPMLTMGYWQENAPDRSPGAYMKALRPDAVDSSSVFSAALKR